jgi:hypothetical protein
MNRQRSNKATYGDNPKSIADIIVPIELTVTLVNKEPFVWKDSGYGDPDRIIVFTTESNIKLLIAHKQWFADGTFEVAPLIYKQMYNISASIKGKILPLVYTLLNRKNEKVYFAFFNMFADVHELAPTEITLDFELATINAVLKVWPRIIIWLCWFHYTQNLWKNIQLKQLAKDYIRVEIVRKLFKYLKYLPFVPVPFVIKAFKEIRSFGSTCKKFDSMFVYFEKFYIGKIVKNTTKRRVPVYPIQRWNVVQRVLEDKDINLYT